MRQILVMFVLLCSYTVSGQYIMSGKIEYERKEHTHAVMKGINDDNNSWFERIKSQIPKFRYSYFDLYFDRNRSIYKPGREVESQKTPFGSSPATDNTVYTDLTTKRVTASKQIFEEKFLIQDSMRKIDWKLKDEIRTIANYKCHKAVGIICDSVYVVAFYTENILASSGPEMFGNLPGMVLEIAIPRLHTTWVATRVETTAPTEDDFKMTSRGKKATSGEMFEVIQGALDDWGKWGARYIWLSVL